MLTKPGKGTLPLVLPQILKQKNMNESVIVAPNERALLTQFLTKLKTYDPDVLVVSGADEVQSMTFCSSTTPTRSSRCWCSAWNATTSPPGTS